VPVTSGGRAATPARDDVVVKKQHTLALGLQQGSIHAAVIDRLLQADPAQPSLFDSSLVVRFGAGLVIGPS